MGESVADATMQPPVKESESADASSDANSDTSADSSDDRRPLLSRLPGILVRVVSWTVLIVCGLLIVGFVLVPRITGSTPYTVLTGSMRPSMPPGTTVVVKPIDFAQITVGDVITYQISSGEPDVVTHRVIGVNVTPEGVRLETQGDANPVPDQELVREEQVRGKVWYWLPVIGYVTNGVTSDTRTWLAQGLGVALIGYAVVTLVVTIVRRKKKDASDDEVGEADVVTVARGDSSATGDSATDDSHVKRDSAMTGRPANADDSFTTNDSVTTDNSAAEELGPVAVHERVETSDFAEHPEITGTAAEQRSDTVSDTVAELPTRRSLRRERAERAGGVDGQSS